MTAKLLAALILLPAAMQAQTARRFDILITELFPDPAPAVGLPNNEFVELTNRSAQTINLQGWKITDGTSTATIKEAIEIKPDSCVILCASSTAVAYAAWGTAIGVASFPSLNNDTDTLTLLAPDGSPIHTVAYSDQWYRNAIKAAGGWTLEMIDTHNPCGGSSNWRAAMHQQGGTPGRSNSIAGPNPDEKPPALLRTYSPDSMTVVAVFDEPLDSASAAQAHRYTFDQGIGQPAAAVPQGPLFQEVLLHLPTPLQPGQVYQLTTRNLTDCSGNPIGSFHQAKAGKPVAPGPLSVIINEILFNPPPAGSDYVELYNPGRDVIDLKQLYVASRTAAGALAGIQQLASSSHLLFPGEYRVLTEDPEWLISHFMVKEHATILSMPALPSLPDDKGTIILLTAHEQVIDELKYDRQWHFGLISEDDGIALERIDYSKPAQDSHNWGSAAATAGFGTPGYQNSQFRADLQAQGTLTVTPALFSPDNDALDDFVNLRFQLPDPGYVVNITIFDAAGHPVRHLARSTTLATQATLRWDGLDNNRHRLPIGIYIILTELFNLQGKTKKFKNAVTLVRRF